MSQAIRARLKSDLFAEVDNFDVTIDTPAAAVRTKQESQGTSLLNLFFYRIEPAAPPSDAGPGNRWYVRALCIITAFSTADPTAHISDGEVDLRILGEVLRYFHEHPILIMTVSHDNIDAHLQIILSALSSEEINQIWSTQGDVPYRPSLLYEIALLPIDPLTHAAPPLPVVAGGIGLQTHADVGGRSEPAERPPVWRAPHMEIDSSADWSPAIAFVVDDEATQAVAFATPADLTDVFVWIAGVADAEVTLIWQRVAQSAWQPLPDAAVATTVPVQPSPPGNGSIDPDHAGLAQLRQVAVPVSETAELLLVAERVGSNGRRLRSNPLIVTIGAAE
jgi:hypothetical protein